MWKGKVNWTEIIARVREIGQRKRREHERLEGSCDKTKEEKQKRQINESVLRGRNKEGKQKEVTRESKET